MNGHEGHDIASLRLVRPDGTVGRLVCLDCDAVLGPLTFYGYPTKRGTRCRTVVRNDLGHRACWSHGEGAGRTNTPREWPAS
jgi:hypothetical protein